MLHAVNSHDAVPHEWFRITTFRNENRIQKYQKGETRNQTGFMSTSFAAPKLTK